MAAAVPGAGLAVGAGKLGKKVAGGVPSGELKPFKKAAGKLRDGKSGDSNELVPKSRDNFTKEVVKRGKPGRDGGQSQHVIEKVDGQTTSTTHQVVKNGKLIHQHQDHVGKHGTIRRFSDELTGTETINAPKVKDTMNGGRLGFPPRS